MVLDPPFPARLSVRAPAKINLGLRVCGKMTDGWHRIETVIARVDLEDEILLELDGTGGRSCSIELSPELRRHLAGGSAAVAASVNAPQYACEQLGGDRNLAVRAADAFLRAFPEPIGIRAHILKRIPWSAGLGGGSSDAAAVLLALRTHLAPSMPDRDLIEIASSLGSDVPAFIPAQSAVLARGRGELISTLAPEEGCELIERPLLIVKPPLASPTAQAYARFGFSEDPAEDQLRDEIVRTGALGLESAQALRTLQLKVRSHLFLGPDRQLTNMNSEAISEVPEGRDESAGGSTPFFPRSAAALRNDFERIVLEQVPVLRSLALHLKQLGAEHVMLAGSGSALVAWFPRDAEQHQAFELLTAAHPSEAEVNLREEIRSQEALLHQRPSDFENTSRMGVVTNGTFVVKARLLK